MPRIVINVCHGGFGLSDEAFEHYLKLKGINYATTESKFSLHKGAKDFWKNGNVGSNSDYLSYYDIDRDDPALVQTVEDLGDKANGWAADLHIVDVPDGVDWYVEEYDGLEHVAEHHRTWG
jgi:hypothetical protein